MKPRLLSSVSLALLLAAAGHAGQRAPATPRELYSAAVSREQALHDGAGKEGAPLRDYRAAVSAYDTIVRMFPASGYVDNALWQGAGIAREAFERFGEERDRSTARRLLLLLVSDYPASAYVAKARETLNRLTSRAAPAERPARPASPRPALLQTHALPTPWGVLPVWEPPDSEGPHGRAVEPPATPTESRLSAPATPRSVTPAAPPKPAPAPPPNRGPVSLARQLGLGASRIVIDPGHGGHDPGALGAGVSEAEVVLDIALRLEALLAAAGLDVVLTRRTDEFVPLDRRPSLATREQADLFLSIHANASRAPAARGIESYYLNFSTDPGAEAVAARENAGTVRTMNNLPEILKAIALNSKLDESRSFASLIQRTLGAQLKPANRTLLDHGVKQAPFVVLIGAEMPSVLVEVAFITNPQEGRLLKSGAYRQRIAQGLCDAVRGYQTSLKSAAVLPSR